jgi:hypothetical protein
MLHGVLDVSPLLLLQTGSTATLACRQQAAGATALSSTNCIEQHQHNTNNTTTPSLQVTCNALTTLPSAPFFLSTHVQGAGHDQPHGGGA